MSSVFALYDDEASRLAWRAPNSRGRGQSLTKRGAVALSSRALHGDESYGMSCDEKRAEPDQTRCCGIFVVEGTACRPIVYVLPRDEAKGAQ